MYGRVTQNYQRKVGINLKELIDRINWSIVVIFLFFKHFLTYLILNGKQCDERLQYILGGNTFANIFGIYVCAHISFAHKKVLRLRTFLV